jgi:hypothetical protein
MVWIQSLLSSRGVAQLILRPWRQTSTYGLWQMGLTVLIALLFYFNLESFVLRDSYWAWRSTASMGNSAGTPVLYFASWLITATVLLVLATPALLKKRPVQPSPSLYPLMVWTALNLLFAFGGLSWKAAVGCTVIVAMVFALALRGMRSTS